MFVVIPCDKASLCALFFCSGRFVGIFSPVLIIFSMLFAENKKKRIVLTCLKVLPLHLR